MAASRRTDRRNRRKPAAKRRNRGHPRLSPPDRQRTDPESRPRTSCGVFLRIRSGTARQHRLTRRHILPSTLCNIFPVNAPSSATNPGLCLFFKGLGEGQKLASELHSIYRGNGVPQRRGQAPSVSSCKCAEGYWRTRGAKYGRPALPEQGVIQARSRQTGQGDGRAERRICYGA